jgi:hypothetical protein
LGRRDCFRGEAVVRTDAIDNKPSFIETNCESEVCAEILRGKGRATNLIGAALSALIVLIACDRYGVPARARYESARKALTPPLDAGGEKRPVRVAPPWLPLAVSARLAEAQDDPPGLHDGQ